MNDPREIDEARAAWQARAVDQTLKKSPERRERFETSSGIEVKRLYTPADVAGHDYLRDAGFPGEYPFARGVQPTMYRGRFWTMRQYAGFGTAEESNRRYHYLLSQGTTGLSVAFDLPTQMGLDSDHARAVGEVGRVGVAIDSLEDMERLLHGIPLDRVSTSMTINATAAILLSLYLAVAEQQGVPWDKVNGTIQNDVLKEYIARGTYIYPPGPSMRIITDVFAFCTERVPNWNTISISGYHIREAGSTAAQEVAFTLANGIAYVEAAIAAGQGVDDFASRLSFFFNVHNDFFEEIAKFRAARRLWAKIMRERFAARQPKSWMLRFHSQTAGSTLTAQQPDNNVVRVTVQALAAVIGGTQSLHTNSRDEALALPSESSAKLALRTQQVVAYESGAADTIDPLAGSYYVESLTDEIQRRAEDYLARIDKIGGAVRAIEAGFQAREIQNAAYRFQQDVEKKKEIVVGVNEFVESEAAPTDILRIDPRLEEEQKARVRAVRARRDAQRAATAMEALDRAAAGRDNLMPFLIEAVRRCVTLGEISDVLRRRFDEYRPQVAV
ncbi:MAG: methylmalonyl-CoA mutase family protein [Deltaproteobacteria bacterium]|nr:methylmalonyl-CoA mutase family protein [Deltaproteobacteria bacterium]